MHPALEVGIPSGVSASSYAIVNRIDAGRRRNHVFVVTKCHRQHRSDGRSQSAKASAKAAAERAVAAAERAVIVNAGGDRGMSQLQQNRATPGGDDHHVPIDSPRDASGTRAPDIRLQQTRADCGTVAIEGLVLRRHALHYRVKCFTV